MKAAIAKLSLFCLLVIAAMSCQKAPEPPAHTTVHLTTYEVREITAVSAVVDAKSGDDYTERGVCWSTIPDPTVTDFHMTNGHGKGEYSCTLTDLEPNQKYYYRAYAYNGKEYVYATDKMDFTTKDGIVDLATGYVTDITLTSAKCNGEITDDGGFAITERGFCWSTSPNPRLDDANDQHVAVSSGTGEFSATLTGLAPGTTYYLRVYAINSQGTSYGNEIIYVTKYTNGVLPGLFTINANGDQVHFSQGNLQYQASTNTWKFAENQWDYIGRENYNISSSYSGWIDLFCWGTSGYNHGAACYQPWSISEKGSDYYAYGDKSYNLYDQTGKADWGYNAISNGGNAEHQWRTLSGDSWSNGRDGEWTYIFESRSTVSGILYVKACVNDVIGIILVPDNWNVSTYSLNNPNESNGDFSANSISSIEWNSILEPAGCVFLPAAGCRIGNRTYDCGSYGAYWSSRLFSGDAGCFFFRDDTDLVSPHWKFSRYWGISVRLVIEDRNISVRKGE